MTPNSLIMFEFYHGRFTDAIFNIYICGTKNTKMKIDLSNIKNIIFDLGRVIVDIHFARTVPAFQKLGLGDDDMDYRKVAETPLFRDLEVGKSTPAEFRDGIRDFLNNSALTDLQIDDAWYAMFGEVTNERIETIKKLNQNYKVYLYSNTNQIHIDRFHADFKEKHGIDFPSLFVKDFYSHEIQDRKPEISSYKKVIELAGINPEETIFIDDLEANCIAAEKAGLQSFCLKEGMEISDLF